MAQTIKLKRSAQSGSSGIPTTDDLELGEVAVNTYHGKMYIKRSNTGGSDIVEVNPDPTPEPVVEDFHTFRPLNLTTSSQTLSFQSDYMATDYNSNHAVEAEVTVDVKYSDGASGFNIINDIEFYLQVRARNGVIGINTHSFTATHVVFASLGGTSCHRISFEGNITKYIGDATAMGTSATTSGYGIKTPLEYYYDPVLNKTVDAYRVHATTFFLSTSSSESLSVNVATKSLATSVDATTIPTLEMISPTFLSS